MKQFLFRNMNVIIFFFLLSGSLGAAVLEQINSSSVQTMTNKTLTSPTLTSPAFSGTATGTLAGVTLTSPTLTSPSISAPGFSGTATGNLTGLAIITPTITSPAFSGTATGSLTSLTLTSPTFITPALGTPASGVMTNATGLPISTGVSGLGSGVATFLATPTTANLLAAVTGETGTGAAVFGTSPTISGATLSGTTSPTGLLDISGASAGQIKFPATQNDSANVNTFDDYEEGTFTPTLGGSATYITQVGEYVKIGKTVFVRIVLTVNTIGTGSSSTISGLPFTSSSNEHALAVSNFTNSINNVTAMFAGVNASTTTITVRGLSAAAASPNVSAIFGNGTHVLVSGHYTT